jgi:hypothetical protein
VASLEAIVQKENEPLRSYLERFNKEVVQVATAGGMKKYLIERGLRRVSDFAKAIGIELPGNARGSPPQGIGLYSLQGERSSYQRPQPPTGHLLGTEPWVLPRRRRYKE